MRRLVIAAGGGGDALGAVMVGASGHEGVDAAIFTYAWERLRVDPLPGPRSASEFTGLRSVGRYNAQIVAATAVKPPRRSMLPRLAGSVATPVLLLDPTRGAAGLRDQIAEVVELADIDVVRLVDIGGDLVARGDEREVTSPLADALVLAACSALEVTAEVVVAGPGLDGELPAAAVVERIHGLGGRWEASLGRRDADAILESLAWHPTEATALLAAAALGYRGTAEIRGEGVTVELTDDSRDVYVADLRAVIEGSVLAGLLVATRSLAEAEDVVREAHGASEIDYEREKAERLRGSGALISSEDLANRAVAFIDLARRRGVDFVTCRRIAEGTAASGVEIAELRDSLRSAVPDHEAFPLWSTRQVARIPD
jgi:hypothetical protein